MCTLPLLAGESYPIRKWDLWAGKCTLPMFGRGRAVGDQRDRRGSAVPQLVGGLCA